MVGVGVVDEMCGDEGGVLDLPSPNFGYRGADNDGFDR